MTHPVHDLDDLTHQRIRLGVLALLSRVEALEFTRIRDELGATDGNLSRHLLALREAGYVAISRSEVNESDGGGGPRSWVSLTPDGASALRREVTALRAMLDHVSVDP